jgi:hypothetical protein
VVGSGSWPAWIALEENFIYWIPVVLFANVPFFFRLWQSKIMICTFGRLAQAGSSLIQPTPDSQSPHGLTAPFANSQVFAAF